MKSIRVILIRILVCGFLLSNIISATTYAESLICDWWDINYQGSTASSICNGPLINLATQTVTSFTGNYTQNYIGYYGTNNNPTINIDSNLLDTNKFTNQIGYYGTNLTLSWFSSDLLSNNLFTNNIWYYWTNNNSTINSEENLLSSDRFLNNIGYYGSNMTFSWASWSLLPDNSFKNTIGFYWTAHNFSVDSNINMLASNKFTSKAGYNWTNYNLSINPDVNLLDPNNFNNHIGYYRDWIGITKFAIMKIWQNSEKYYLAIPKQQNEKVDKCFQWDPVILTTWEFVYEDNVLSVWTNIWKLNLSFKYNSQNNYTWLLGNNIHLNLLKSLDITSDKILLVDWFNWSRTYKYDEVTWKYMNLTAWDSATLIKTVSWDKEVYTIKDSDDLTYIFDEDWRLQYADDNFWHRLLYSYNLDWNISDIEIWENKKITFEYNNTVGNSPFWTSKTISKIRIDTLPSILFTYDTNSNLTSYEIVKDWEITWDKTNFVYVTSKNFTNIVWLWTNINMSKITLPSWEEYLTNVYDNNDRVISQKLWSWTLVFDYETNWSWNVISTTVTDRNWNKSKYSADSKWWIIDRTEWSWGLMTFYDLDINWNTVKEESYYWSKDDINNAILTKEIAREYNSQNELTQESISTEVKNETYKTRRIDHIYAANKKFTTTSYGYDPIYWRMKRALDSEWNMAINTFDYEEWSSFSWLALKTWKTVAEISDSLSWSANLNLWDINEDWLNSQYDGNIIKTAKYLSGHILGANTPYSVEIYSYNSEWRMIKDVASNKNISEFVYDSLGNLIHKSVSNPNSSIVLASDYTFDWNSNLLTESWQDWTTTNQYDVQWRVIQTISQGSKETYEYTTNWDLASQSEFVLHKATWEYIITKKNNYETDTNWNKTKDETIYYSGWIEVKRDTVTYQYDWNEKLISQSDDTTPAPILKYDDYNNLVLKVENSWATNETRTIYSYNDIWNLLSQTTTIGDRSKTTTYEYDKYQNNIKTISSDWSYTVTALDDAWKTTSTKNYLSDGTLIRTQKYDYNNLWQVSKAYMVYWEWSESQMDTVEYLYNDFWEKVSTNYSNWTTESWSTDLVTSKPLVTIDTNNTITTYAYNTWWILLAKNTKLWTNIDTTEGYVYNSDNQLISKSVDWKTLETYEYNDFWKLYKVSDSVTWRVKTTSYDLDGRISSETDNDKLTKMSYDTKGNTIEMAIYDIKNPDVKIYDITYEYNSDNKLIKKNYISASGTQWKRSIAYEYNIYGEQTKKTNLWNDVEVDSTTTTFDSDGRPTVNTISSTNLDYFWTNIENYEFDIQGRMKSITLWTTDGKNIKNELEYNIRWNLASEKWLIDNSIISKIWYSYNVNWVLNKVSTDLWDNSLVWDNITSRNDLEYTYNWQKLVWFTSKWFNKGWTATFNKNILSYTYSDPSNLLPSSKVFWNNLTESLIYNTRWSVISDSVADATKDLYKVNYSYADNWDIINEDITKYNPSSLTGVLLSNTYIYDNYNRVSRSISDKDSSRIQDSKYDYSVMWNRIKLEEIKAFETQVQNEQSNFSTWSSNWWENWWSWNWSWSGSETGTGTETNSWTTESNTWTTSWSGTETGSWDTSWTWSESWTGSETWSWTETNSWTTESWSTTWTWSETGTWTELWTGTETNSWGTTWTWWETPNLALPEDNSWTTNNPTTQSRIVNYTTNDFNAYTNLTEDITYSSWDTIVNGTWNNVVFQYDNRGNLKEDNKYKYYYDYKNRLTKVTSLDWSLISKYYYNWLGNRIEKDVWTERILYTYSSIVKWWALAEIKSDNWNLVNIIYYNYEWSSKIINSTKSTDTSNNTDDNKSTYFYQDRLGSTKFITDDSLDVLQSYEYDDYWKIRKIETTTNSWTTILDEVNNLLTDRLYAWYIYDSEINLYFLKNRHYSAELGRFIQTDPIEEWDDVNLYAYTKNNPLNWVDPEGTKSDCSNWNTINKPKVSSPYLLLVWVDNDWEKPTINSDWSLNMKNKNWNVFTAYLNIKKNSSYYWMSSKFDIEVVTNFTEFNNAIHNHKRARIMLLAHWYPESIVLNHDKKGNWINVINKDILSKNHESIQQSQQLWLTALILYSCNTWNTDRSKNTIAQQLADHYWFMFVQAPNRYISAYWWIKDNYQTNFWFFDYNPTVRVDPANWDWLFFNKWWNKWK